jgi:hypothetical protein
MLFLVDAGSFAWRTASYEFVIISRVARKYQPKEAWTLTIEDEQVLRSLENKHWRFFFHIKTVESELRLALQRPLLIERMMERSENEAITDFWVEEAKTLERLREHDKLCGGCQKPTETTEEGIRAALEASYSCM